MNNKPFQPPIGPVFFPMSPKARRKWERSVRKALLPAHNSTRSKLCAMLGINPTTGAVYHGSGAKPNTGGERTKD